MWVPLTLIPKGLLCALVTASNSYHRAFALSLSLASNALPRCCMGPCLASFSVCSNAPFLRFVMTKMFKMSTFHSGHSSPLFCA